MSFGGKDEGLKSERRDRIDGGLNTRSSPTTIDPSEATLIDGWVFTEEGSLCVRSSQTLALQVLWPQAASVLPAPVLTQIVGGGTLAAGDYQVLYFLTAASTAPVTGFFSAIATITVGANDRIQVDVPPNNLGETAGQTATGYDDPVNGNMLPTAGNGPYILIRKTTFGASYQGFSFTGLMAWNAAGVQRGTLTAAADQGGAGYVQDTVGQLNFPLRYIVWHPGIQKLIGVMVDRAGMFSQDLTTFTYNGIAKDKNGALTYWSRLQTNMSSGYVDGVMSITDGLSKPKHLHFPSRTNLALAEWRVSGSDAPATAPTTVLNAAAGNLTGYYTYKVAWVYNDTRSDLTVLEFESNSSPRSVALTVTAQKIDVTIPANPDVSGIAFRRVYRTSGQATALAAAGAPLFFHSDQAAGLATLTFTDNTADSGLTTDTPVDLTGTDPANIPNDPPPARGDLLIEHQGRLWLIESNYILDNNTDQRIVGSLPTNFARRTKVPSLGTSEATNAWPIQYRLPMGDSSPVTAWVSYNGEIIVFRGDAIGRISGTDDDSYFYTDTHEHIGACRNSVLQVGAQLYFWEDARGPFLFDGYREQQIGWKIQNSWIADRAAGYRPFTVWFDPDLQCVVWGLTTLTISPPDGVTVAFPEAWKEYAYYIPSKSWTTLLTAASAVPSRAITASDRVVLGADLESQMHTQVFSNRSGRLYLDHPVALGADAITATVDLALFLGGSWEMIKMAKYLTIFYSKPQNTSFNLAFTFLVYAQTIADPAWHLLATVASTDSYHKAGNIADGYAFGSILPEHIRVYDIPTDLILNLRYNIGNSATETRDEDWGLRLRIVSSTQDLRIRGVGFKYKESSDIQKLEWPAT